MKATDISIHVLGTMKKLIDSRETGKIVRCTCCLFSCIIDNKLSISITKPPLMPTNIDTYIIDNKGDNNNQEHEMQQLTEKIDMIYHITRSPSQVGNKK